MEICDYMNKTDIKNDIVSLPKYFRNRLKLLNEICGKENSLEEIAKNLEISSEMLQKKLNGSKPLSREWTIAICIVFGLNEYETNRILNFAGYSRLDWNVLLDCVLLCYINTNDNINNVHTLKEINDYLNSYGCERICIKFRRNQSTDSEINNQDVEKYEVRKSVITKSKVPYWSTFRNSKYESFAEAKLLKDGEVKYTLCISSDGKYISIKENSNEVTYRTIAETGAFSPYFKELFVVAKNEQRKIDYLLFDSKNFQTSSRIAIKFENDDFHVLCEAFNQDHHAYSKYYLMEYVDSQVKFSISNQSMFMKEYLSTEEYNYHYGYLPIANRKTFCGYINFLENEIVNKFKSEGICYNSVYSMFLEIKSTMIYRIKEFKNEYNSRDFTIRDMDDFNNEYDLIKFFNLEKEFKCEYDEETYEIVSACKKTSIIYEDEKYSIAFADLTKAYRLGMNDIGQLCHFIKKHKSFKDSLNHILEILENVDNRDYWKIKNQNLNKQNG